GLEIFYFQNQYVMQVRKEYSKIARKFAPGLDISRAALKTLSLIAIEQPIMKSKVVEIRGKHAYKHIKELIRQGYVKAEKTGKTSVLKTTERFTSLIGEENIKKAKIKKELKNESGNSEEKTQ
ncbi:MAG: SMC-Scp complex subunit ScpB, partial [Candidatus Brockarchaeota archaeon]|nr:SMC-Scp complex subunit ScpB [Candidatus Brockarchaeota archaeon]